MPSNREILRSRSEWLSPFCHPEGGARRTPCQVIEGFFASLRMTIKKSKLKAQNSKPQLKTLKLTFGHPEGEARRIYCQLAERFFAHAQNDSLLSVILRAKPEGSLANSFLSSWTKWRISCQLAEGFFANAQNDTKKMLRMAIKKDAQNDAKIFLSFALYSFNL